jgi:hypothetical protein
MAADDPVLAVPLPPDAYLVTGEGSERAVRRLRSVVSTIGRAPDCDVVIDDPGVSRRHARIAWDGGRFTVDDLGSTNGTALNGHPLAGPAQLSDGDVILLAGVRLEFQFNPPTVVRALEPAPSSSPVAVNLATHEVSVHGQPVDLTPKEYLLLAALYRRAGVVAGQDELAREVWPEANGDVPGESVHQLVARLRKKLGEPRLIVTVKGFGYRFAPDA